MKKAISLVFGVLLLVFLASCGCKHQWQNATCTRPTTCSKCGETAGSPLGHTWKDATCQAPMTCAICGETTGTALEHQWQEAACTRPTTCFKCGETAGSPLGHTWKDATCQAPMTCAICGETTGTALEHQWQEATCTRPTTCSICGETTGTTLEHQWQEATCEVPESCALCGEARGEATGHELDNIGKCTICGTAVGIPLTLDNYSEYFSLTGHENFYAEKVTYGTHRGEYWPRADYWFTGSATSGYTYHNVYITMMCTPSNSAYWGVTAVGSGCNKNGVLGDGMSGYTGKSFQSSCNSYDTRRDVVVYYSTGAAASNVGAPKFSWSVKSITGYVLPIDG